MATAVIESPLGPISIEGDREGITRISITDGNGGLTPKVPVELQQAASQLNRYFEGNLQAFDLKLNLTGTDFQKKVWQQLLKIPFGETRSYLELARQVGDVKAIRAVAAANGKNPLWIAIPCHRVVGSDGSLTGYAGGLWRKRWLLKHEGQLQQISLFETL